MPLRTLLLIPCFAAALSGCGHHDPPRIPPARTAPTLTDDPAHPGQTTGWVDTRLYFGLGPADSPKSGLSEAAWREFLDREVTPRFPSGLSVLDLYGQWLSKGQSTLERVRTKMLIIDYQDTQENREKIESIRSAWKAMTGDQSVLRVTQPADVSF
jgi:Protein of unknown function (DUF3574)